VKRDFEIIRLLMLQFESGEKPPKLNDYPEEEIVYNAALLIEAGLAKGSALYDASKGRDTGAVVERLTWAGHDFLDATRDETIWKKAREKVMKPAAAFTFGILLDYLKREAKRRIFGDESNDDS
jgi:hypothetical protein